MVFTRSLDLTEDEKPDVNLSSIPNYGASKNCSQSWHWIKLHFPKQIVSLRLDADDDIDHCDRYAMLLTNINEERMMMTMRTIGYAGSIYGRYRRHLGLGPDSTIPLYKRTTMMMMIKMINLDQIQMTKEKLDLWNHFYFQTIPIGNWQKQGKEK